jgi:hypothetical protein
MHAAAAPALFPQDRVCDWLDEMRRVAGDARSLPPAARRAVSSVLASLRREADRELTLVQRRRVDEVLAELSRQN